MESPRKIVTLALCLIFPHSSFAAALPSPTGLRFQGDSSFHLVTVSLAGSGSGTVTSSPVGVDCPGACAAAFKLGNTVTLTAAPSAGATFTGWTGGAGSAAGCSGTGTCVVSTNSDGQITANFGSGPVADQYVSPHGSDANDGLAATAGGGHGPVADLATAQAHIRPLLGTKPLLVLVEDGSLDGAATPYYGSSVAFTASDNGTQAAPVTYQSYPGHAPVISGGKRLGGGGANGTWLNITGQAVCNGVNPCYQISLDTGTYRYFEALHYNGARRFRPRLGAGADGLGAYYRACQSSTGAVTSFVYSPTDPISASWANMTVSKPGLLPSGQAAPANDIELFDFEKWTVPVMRLASVNTTPVGSCGGTITLTGATINSDDHGYIKGHRYLIENVKSELKRPGQWFLDRSVSPWLLTYLGNPGENPDDDYVVVPQKAQVLVATNLQWTTFDGLTFEHDDFTVPQAGYASKQLDPGIAGMVLCTACTNVSFINGIFARTMGVGLDVQGASSFITVTGNAFYDIGAIGARFGTSPSGSSTEAGVPGAGSSAPGTYNILFNNNGVAGVSRFFASGDGVMLGLAHNVEIGNNTIYDAYHDAVEMCMPSGGVCGGSGTSQGLHDIYVHDNDASQVLQGVTNDGGCYYMMDATPGGAGAGNKLIHNKCHDSTDAKTQDSDGYGGHGIYLDSYSGGVDVEQNLIYRVTATGLNMTLGPAVDGIPNVFKNNIVADPQQSMIGVGCPLSAPLLQFDAFNNIFRSRLGNSVNVQKGGGRYYGTGDPTLMQNFAGNNYFNSKTDWTTGSHFYYEPNANCSGSTAITWNNWTGQSGSGPIPGTTGNEDANTRIADAGFVKPYCTLATAAACAADSTQDDFNFSGAVPPNFNCPGGASTCAQGQPLNLVFGRTGGPALPAVGATFLTAPTNPSTSFCPSGQCP